MKFICTVCGWSTEADSMPEKCPICGATTFKALDAEGKVYACGMNDCYELGTDDKDILDIISMFTGRDKDELRKYPMDFINEILIHLQFMNTPLNIKPSNWVEIDGKKYSINYMEKLKFGEFVDVETIIKDNKYNYPAILGVLCRMEGEVYDDDFIAEKLNDRVKMFEELDMPSAMRLINFFLKLSLRSIAYTQKSLAIQQGKEQAELLAQSIRDSLKDGDLKKLDMIYAKTELRKLEKSLKSI